MLCLEYSITPQCPYELSLFPALPPSICLLLSREDSSPTTPKPFQPQHRSSSPTNAYFTLASKPWHLSPIFHSLYPGQHLGILRSRQYIPTFPHFLKLSRFSKSSLRLSPQQSVPLPGPPTGKCTASVGTSSGYRSIPNTKPGWVGRFFGKTLLQ